MTNSEILIYQNSDGNIKIDVRLEEETVWLTQAQLCELFQKSKATISEHIKNVFEEGELDEKAKLIYIQFIGVIPFSIRKSLHLLKCLFPKNPREAERGEG